jgi:hypothetical protein
MGRPEDNILAILYQDEREHHRTSRELVRLDRGVVEVWVGLV